jgi:hypothetical protein
MCETVRTELVVCEVSIAFLASFIVTFMLMPFMIISIPEIVFLLFISFIGIDIIMITKDSLLFGWRECYG